MGGCCRWTWLVRPGDTPDEARIKTVITPFALFVAFFGVLIILANLQTSHQLTTVIAEIVIVLALLVFIGGVVSNIVSVGNLLDVLIVVVTLCICGVDLGNAAASWGFRSWAYVVLVLDVALIFKRDHLPRLLIPFVLVYLAALQ
eukprot:Hpha_TRINITY_DN16406_c3_g10::TRINITY_DN16406_c3_g10_i1::g.160187::m.160187